MKNFENFLFSPRGMGLVNTLFILSYFFLGLPLRLAAYVLWAVYLTAGLRRTPSRVVRIVYALLLIFVFLVLAVNTAALLGLF